MSTASTALQQPTSNRDMMQVDDSRALVVASSASDPATSGTTSTSVYHTLFSSPEADVVLATRDVERVEAVLAAPPSSITGVRPASSGTASSGHAEASNPTTRRP